MSKADIVKQILDDSNPLLNTNAGSPVEGLVIVPSSEVFEVIQGKVDQANIDAALLTATTSERKDALLGNYGVSRREGKVASGKLKITVSPNLAQYNFPTGTVFTDLVSGVQVESTSDVIIQTAQTTEKEVPVVTQTITSEVIDIGVSFNSSLYGNLITSVKVSQQIGGGSEQETDDELVVRIIEDLSENSMNVNSLRTKILKQFPDLIDVQASTTSAMPRTNMVGRPSGIKGDIYIKPTLTTKVLSVNDVNNTITIEDTIAEISSTSRAILTHTVKNRGTAFEVNNFTIADADESLFTIEYKTPSLLSEVQEFLDDKDTFPIGTDFVAVIGEPLFLSSSSIELDSNYVVLHPLTNFSVSDLVTETKLTGFDLPIIIEAQSGYTGNVFEITNKDDRVFPAYYVR